MNCYMCNNKVNYRNSCNVNDKRVCIKCAYKSFPKGSPAKEQFKKVYGTEVTDIHTSGR